MITTLEKAVAFAFDDTGEMPTVIRMNRSTRNSLDLERVARSPITSFMGIDLQAHLHAIRKKAATAMSVDLLEVPLGLMRIEIDDGLADGAWVVE